MSRQLWRDAGFTLGLGALALSGLGTTFGPVALLVAAGTGLLAGTGIAVLTRRLALRVPIALGVAAVFVLGPLAGLPWAGPLGALPTPSRLAAVLDGTVHGWWQLITTLPPVGARDHLRMVPFVCALAAGLGGMLLARAKAAPLPVLAPAVVLVVVVLFGADATVLVGPVAAGFAAGAVSWAALRRAVVSADPAGARRTRRAPLVAAAMLAVAGTLAVAVGGVVPPQVSRYTLREQVQPPFDPSAYPSPLAGLRRYEVRDKQTPLFTVQGAVPPKARIRLSTMDSYDGSVWSVVNGGGARGNASGIFERVGERIPAAAGTAKGRASTLTVTVQQFSDVWLPTVGATTGIRFGGARADTLADSFRLNRATGTAVVPAGLRAGDSYTIDVVAPPVPEAEALAGRPFADTGMPELSSVPDNVTAAALEWTAGESGAYARLAALQGRLREGAYSDGSDGAGVPARPGHGAGRLRDFVDAEQLVGDAEQYTATFGLMLRRLGVPARVVFGVVPPQGWDGQVTGALITAWVEVRFDGAGWVPFDPTPPVTNKPDPLKRVEQPQSEAQLKLPPLVVTAPQIQLPPPDQQEEQPHDPDRGLAGLPPWAMFLVRYVAPPVLAVAILLGAIAGAKALRRSRRRTRGTRSARIVAGWTELLDRLADAGARPPDLATRRETARAAGEPDLDRLARTADGLVFAGAVITDDTIDTYWRDMSAVAAGFARRRGRLRRWAGAFDPRTLVRFRRPRKAVRA